MKEGSEWNVLEAAGRERPVASPGSAAGQEGRWPREGVGAGLAVGGGAAQGRPRGKARKGANGSRCWAEGLRGPEGGAARGPPCLSAPAPAPRFPLPGRGGAPFPGPGPGVGVRLPPARTKETAPVQADLWPLRPRGRGGSPLRDPAPRGSRAGPALWSSWASTLTPAPPHLRPAPAPRAWTTQGRLFPPGLPPRPPSLQPESGGTALSSHMHPPRPVGKTRPEPASCPPAPRSGSWAGANLSCLGRHSSPSLVSLLGPSPAPHFSAQQLGYTCLLTPAPAPRPASPSVPPSLPSPPVTRVLLPPPSPSF